MVRVGTDATSFGGNGDACFHVVGLRAGLGGRGGVWPWQRGGRRAEERSRAGIAGPGVQPELQSQRVGVRAAERAAIRVAEHAARGADGCAPAGLPPADVHGATIQLRAATRASYPAPSAPPVVVEKHTQRDAAIGAAAGAVLGATTSRDKVKGGLIGAVVGGVLGGVVGNNVDITRKSGW